MVRLRGEGSEHSVAHGDLSLEGERSVTEDPLAEFPRPAGSAAPVRKLEVVEDEQLTRTEADVDFDGVQSQTSS